MSLRLGRHGVGGIAGLLLLASLALGATSCLPPVEHVAELGDGLEVRFSQVSSQRLSRAVWRTRFSVQLVPNAAQPTRAPRRVDVASTSVLLGVETPTLFFPAAEGAALADRELVVDVDRSEPFDPAALLFTPVVPATPALASSLPAEGAEAVVVSAWLRLLFEEATDPAALAGFALECDGAAHPVHLAGDPADPRRVVANPVEELPADAACALAWTGPFGTELLSFDTSADAGAAQVLYDRSNRGTWPPFPDDAFLAPDPATSTGFRVEIPVLEREADVAVLSSALVAATEGLDGWSPLGPIVVVLSEAPDEASLPRSAAESLDPGASAGLVDIDPTSPEQGQRIPFELDVRSEQIGTGPVAHQLVVFPSRPLRPATRYAFYVTRQAATRVGARPYAASPFFAAATAPALPGEAPETAPVRTQAGEALAALEALPGVPVPREDVALALSIRSRSTDSIPADVLAMRADVDAAPPPAFTVVSCSPSPRGDETVVRGTWMAPDWRADGTFLERDGSGRPVLQGSRPVPFVLALPPAAEAGPLPITMYQHGNPGSAEELVNEAAQYLSGDGFATLGFTDPLNNELGDTTRQFLGTFFNLLTASDIPEYWMQTYGEQLAFLRMIPTLDALDVLPLEADGSCGGDGLPELDPTLPLTYVGISFGGVHGSALFAYAPEITAGALVTGGGGFVERLFLQSETDPTGTGSFLFDELAANVPSLLASDLWAGLGVFQLGYDDQDPNNHAAFVYADPLEIQGTTRKPSMVLTEGIDDELSPNNATRAEAFAHGPIPQLSPFAEVAPFLEQVEDEVVANIDPTTTAALTQVVPLGVPGIPATPGCGFSGHGCGQNAPQAVLQRRAFLLSALREPAPILVDPEIDRDGDGLLDAEEIILGTDPLDPADP